MSDIKIVRLTSGEEIIATVTETDSHVKLKKPAILIPAGKDQLAFGQWLPYADIKKDGIEIDKKFTLFIVDALDELTDQYREMFGSGLVVARKNSPSISGAGMPENPPLKLTQ